MISKLQYISFNFLKSKMWSFHEMIFPPDSINFITQINKYLKHSNFCATFYSLILSNKTKEATTIKNDTNDANLDMVA